MIMEFVLQTILRPLSQRVGTFVGSYLSALGMAVDDVSTVVAAVPLVLGVVLDLIQRKLY